MSISDFRLTQLKRYPHRKNDRLQAWDAADELLLKNLQEHPPEGRVLVVNDHWGALSLGLSSLSLKSDVVVYTDSYLSFRGIQSNAEGVVPVTELKDLQGPFSTVVIRIPKNLSFFEDILSTLTRVMEPGGRVVCGYQIKHQASSAFSLLNQWIGATTASLAHKKARLIFCKFERQPKGSPFPLQVKVDSLEYSLTNHSNVFSREKLDIGTRFLLENLPSWKYSSVLDLACGNGILGIAAKLKQPHAKLSLSDESKMAILSAQVNCSKFFVGSESEKGGIDFHWTDGAQSVPSASLELVLCNPPFHQGHTIEDHTVRSLFAEAKRVLKSGGVLRVVANSHLPYLSILRRLFGEAHLVKANRKFQILDALKAQE